MTTFNKEDPKVSDLLKDARSVLVDKGWTRGRYYRKGRHCALGALVAAYTGNHELGRNRNPLAVDADYGKILHTPGRASLIMGQAARTLANAADHGGQLNSAAALNDAQPSKKKVLQWFDLAIELAEQEEGA